ncbi:CFI-box-CTERM domain-containing protein [Mesorhizobium sp.]|uniref:CFI-box-CTERM domain-containing protein n=1 Tax=Mesorhizobium sp. TaxID=1871066 RepID=UPI003457E009
MSQVSATFCFVATAFEGKYREEPLQKYLRFRDSHVAPHAFGRLTIRTYYFLSPYAAKFLTQHPAAQRLAGSFLLQLSRAI